MQMGYPMPRRAPMRPRTPNVYPRHVPRTMPARGPAIEPYGPPATRPGRSVPSIPLSPLRKVPRWARRVGRWVPYFRVAGMLLDADDIARSWLLRNEQGYSGLTWGCFRGNLPWAGVNGLVAWKYYNSDLSNTCGLLQAYDHTAAPLPELDGGSWKHYFSWPKGGQWIVEFNRLGGQIGPLSGVSQRMTVKGAWLPVHLIWYQGSSQAIPQEALDLGYPDPVAPTPHKRVMPVPQEVPVPPPYRVLPWLNDTPWRETGPLPKPTAQPKPNVRPARPPYGRERKTNSKMLEALLSVWHVATEFSDFVDNIYGAIPNAPKLRGDAAKIAYIAMHITDIDPYKAIRDLLLNEVQDRLIGRMHRALDKAGVGIGFTGTPYLKQKLRN